MIRLEYLESILSYDPIKGELRWLKDRPHLLRGDTHCKGKLTGQAGQVSINGYSHNSHILAWILYYKKPPISYIRFLDGNKRNIKLENMTDTGSRTNRICTQCGVKGGPELFYEQTLLKSGLSPKCKECYNKSRTKPEYKYKKKKVDPNEIVVMPDIVKRSLATWKPPVVRTTIPPESKHE